MKHTLPSDGKIHEIYEIVFELMTDHHQARKQVLAFVDGIGKTKKELRSFDFQTWLFKNFPHALYKERYAEEKERVLSILEAFSKEFLGDS